MKALAFASIVSAATLLWWVGQGSIIGISLNSPLAVYFGWRFARALAERDRTG